MVEQKERKARKYNFKLGGQKIQATHTNGIMLSSAELTNYARLLPLLCCWECCGSVFSGLGKYASRILQHVELNYITLPFQQTLKMLKSYCFWFHSRYTCVKLSLNAILHSSQIIFLRKNTASNIIDKINHKTETKWKTENPVPCIHKKSIPGNTSSYRLQKVQKLESPIICYLDF